MRLVLRWTKRLALAALVTALLAVAALYGLSERILRKGYDARLAELGPLPADSASVAEGIRLARIRGCYDGCHGEAFSGGEPFKEEGFPGFMLGTFVAPDLTVLAASHSDAELDRAIRRGVRTDGRGAVAMPSNMFQTLSDEDVSLILAAIRAEAVGDGPPTRVAPGPMARWFMVSGMWPLAIAGIDPQAVRPAKTPTEPAELGPYLAQTVCTECHGPELLGQDGSPPLAVVLGYSRDLFGRLMHTGVPASGAELGLMRAVALGRTIHFTDPEVDALYAYLNAAETWEGDGSIPVTTETAGARAGWFGEYGGQFVPETLIPALDELTAAWAEARSDPAFREALDACLRDYVGRPTPISAAERLGERLGGVRVWLKREDLNHTGAHKINNTMGQALLARRMGKRRIIAETGAGQHGVATATACAVLDFECAVYMGEEDMRRQALNVTRMELLGAEVIPVSSGSRTLKDATNEAIRDWVTNVDTTHYIIGSVVGPAPYPELVRDFQRVIGDEAVAQLAERGIGLAAAYACVGGGSNAIGMFAALVEANEGRPADERIELVGVEAAGHGIETGEHSASLAAGEPGVLHGNFSYLLQDAGGQVVPAHSVSAGLDYPGVGPEHAWLKDTGRVRYEAVTDEEALAAFQDLCRLEGIIPALETAHAIAGLAREAERWRDRDVLICLSGRGDKDVAEVARILRG